MSKLEISGTLGAVNIAAPGQGLSSFQIHLPDQPRGKDTVIVSCSLEMAVEAASLSGQEVTVTVSVKATDQTT